MKRNEIQAVATAKINEYLNDGYVLEFNNVLYGGIDGAWLLNNGEKRVCICQKQRYDRVGRKVEFYCFNVKFGDIFLDVDNREPFASFYGVSDDWFVTDYEEFSAAMDVRVNRQREDAVVRERTVTVSDKVVEVFQKVFDAKKLDAKHLKVSRVSPRKGFRGSYKVEYLNRLGNVKATRSYRLGCC